MAPEKTCGPATTLSFAGIELDSICSEARLTKFFIFKGGPVIDWPIEFCLLSYQAR